MRNKSAGYSQIYIKIVAIDGNTVKYQLGATTRQQTFKWGATIGSDRMAIAKLVVGKKYWIMTSSDAYGTQHWGIPSEVKQTIDPITTVGMKRMTKPQVRPDFLIFDEPPTNDFTSDNPHKDDPVLGPIFQRIIDNRNGVSQ
jgi:hypothetical protein